MSQAVAERYARAIFEIGNESRQLAQLSEQIRKFAEVYESSSELRLFLDNPVIAEEKREGLLKDLGARLGMAQFALNAVRLLASRRRLGAIPDVSRELQRLSDESQGVMRATVISAKPLPEAYYQKLVTELEKATSRKILLQKEQDPTLIAGVITKIGDRTIDGSLKGRLASIERQLASS